MPQRYVLSIKKEISLVESPEGQVMFKSPQLNLSLGNLSPGLISAIRVLFDGGASEQDLGNIVLQHDGPSVVSHFYLFLHQFHSYKIICRTIDLDGASLATLVPTSFYYKYAAIDVDPDLKYILSRFAYCRREGSSLVVESPRGHARVILHASRAAAVLAQLSSPQSSSEVSEQQKLPLDVVTGLIEFLLNAGTLCDEKNDDEQREDADAPLTQWDFHDLLFHSRSRVGRHLNPYGGTYRYKNKIEPLPGTKPPMSEETYELFKPDLERLKEFDCPFTRVLEDRKSIRSHGDPPLTAEQLGEFLFRSARVREVFKTDHGELSSRPYPAGGAIYELEIYAVVNKCSGLPSGLYHYQPDDHLLSKLSDRTKQVERLLESARHTAVQEQQPQVLLVVTARFQRVTWKYQSMAYALILKHVGVLYQTLYLVGTAMGLATCALGGGDSDLFAEAADLNYYAEASVGEFILGSWPGAQVQ